ncbi:MAG: rhomboid family intramembrane serine protease [Planctomycetaceae bacterium]|jgi:membrane associated rhomboid family serine protease|nr:rhomboid family intramembrane serine protease [Planctomycetaceae bacterium]
MGFQDRDYNRYESYDDYGYRRPRSGSLSVTLYLILINVLLWIANGFFFPNNSLTEFLAIEPGTWNTPENWWKFLTYGFAHAPYTFWHIGGNMLGLVMFGYGMMLGLGPGGIGLFRGENIENRLGRAEYLVFYLLTIIFSGMVYAVFNPTTGCLGASGGVTGIVILYAFFYPAKTLLLWGILPLPMWAIGLMIVFMDAGGASGVGKGGIAYSAHLAGAFFALLYYFLFARHHQRITDSFTGWGKKFRKIFKRTPKLHIYPEKDNLPNTNDTSVKATKPETKPEKKPEKNEEFEKRLDEILGRYGKVGEAGLTKEEREFLQYASKKYRDKNK